MNRDIGAGRGIFSTVDPGVIRAVPRDVNGVDHDWWIARTIEALRTFLPNADTPSRVISRSGAKGQQEDRVMRGLWRSRSCWWLFRLGCCRGRLRQ